MSEQTSGSAGASEERYWFNLRTRQVEFGKLTAALFRVGPFASAEEAKNAPKLLAERAEKWRDEEEKDL